PSTVPKAPWQSESICTLIGVADVVAVAADAAIAAVTTASTTNGISVRLRIPLRIRCPPLDLVWSVVEPGSCTSYGQMLSRLRERGLLSDGWLGLPESTARRGEDGQDAFPEADEAAGRDQHDDEKDRADQGV